MDGQVVAPRVDQIAALDGLRPEAQMADGHAAYPRLGEFESAPRSFGLQGKPKGEPKGLKQSPACRPVLVHSERKPT